MPISTPMEVAAYFGLKDTDARYIAAQVAVATTQWREEAAGHRIGRQEIERMAFAFEHEDLREALT